jgi:anti-sigma regulatory factor (Ser/Thr protein kinase)
MVAQRSRLRAAAVGARRAFRAHLERYAASESDVPGAELIFAELVSNIVRHARGPASFILDWHQARPTLFVLDRGNGIREAPHAFPEVTADRGRGLALVNAIAVQMRVGKRRGIGAYVCAILPVLRRPAVPAESL